MHTQRLILSDYFFGLSQKCRDQDHIKYSNVINKLLNELNVTYTITKETKKVESGKIKAV